MSQAVPIRWRLAREFVRRMQNTLTEEQLEQVDQLNLAEQNPSVCHSHDFCDANVVMAAAFKAIVGRESDPASNEDAAIWNEAWNLARSIGLGRSHHRVKLRAQRALDAALERYPWLVQLDGRGLVCPRCDQALEVVERAKHVAALYWDFGTSFYEGKQTVEDSLSVVQCGCEPEGETMTVRPDDTVGRIDRRFEYDIDFQRS